MKKIIYILIALLSITLVSGELFNHKNETIEITPIIEDICNINQTSVFHIVRLNYTSGNNPLILNYNQTLTTDNSLIQTNIEKEINSYTKANTGRVIFEKNNNYLLTFQINNKTINWNYQITSCNATIETNETIPEINYTSNFNINTNKNIFNNKETITLYFNNIDETNYYNITYWIEDLKNNIVKSKYTSENNNPKSYTPAITTEEKAFLFKAILNQNNQTYSQQKLFVVTNSIEETENSEENILKLEEYNYDYKEEKLDLEIYLEKNTGSKRIVNIYLTKDNKTICEKIKIDMLRKNKLKLQTSIKCSQEIINSTLIIEGLNETATESLQINSFPKIQYMTLLNGTTQKQYAEDNLTWSVKLKGKGLALLILETENFKEFKQINISKDSTIKFILPAKENMNIKTTLITNNNIQTTEYNLSLISRTKNTATNLLNNINLTETSLTPNKITSNVVKQEENRSITEYTEYVFTGLILLVLTIIGFKIFSKKHSNDSFIKK